MNTKKLKVFLAENEITLEKAAKLCDMNYNTIQRVFSTGNCNLKTAKKLIVGLKMPLNLANEIFFADDVAI